MKEKAVDLVPTLVQSPGLAQNPILEGKGHSQNTGVDPIIDHVQDKKIDVDLRAHIKNDLNQERDGNQGVVRIHGTSEKTTEKRSRKRKE
ncbi:splicing regulatory glutamic acid and lysine rich protein 1 [Rhinolophus ferrumequinum]|uniref:Splicing regulatory glutamic acid and lysine rich protein 1 n=1 Tax=Rhinolophus ferrumequinum TaxID=59479 RepID=A0A7J7Y6S1_RHIFE|nr:splicing regulatory glutamic acid and lysine rich protein 1 [Rhinolophus ferrumequinum]